MSLAKSSTWSSSSSCRVHRCSEPVSSNSGYCDQHQKDAEKHDAATKIKSFYKGARARRTYDNMYQQLVASLTAESLKREEEDRKALEEAEELLKQKQQEEALEIKKTLQESNQFRMADMGRVVQFAVRWRHKTKLAHRLRAVRKQDSGSLSDPEDNVHARRSVSSKDSMPHPYTPPHSPHANVQSALAQERGISRQVFQAFRQGSMTSLDRSGSMSSIDTAPATDVRADEEVKGTSARPRTFAGHVTASFSDLDINAANKSASRPALGQAAGASTSLASLASQSDLNTEESADKARKHKKKKKKKDKGTNKKKKKKKDKGGDEKPRKHKHKKSKSTASVPDAGAGGAAE